MEGNKIINLFLNFNPYKPAIQPMITSVENVLRKYSNSNNPLPDLKEKAAKLVDLWNAKTLENTFVDVVKYRREVPLERRKEFYRGVFKLDLLHAILS